MGTFAIDLLSGKEFLFNKTFGTSSGTTTPVWGGISGDINNQVDLMNYFDTKVSNNIFTGYTATTDVRISALINDYNYYDTESNILALDPSFSGYVNQKIWSTDTKEHKFVTQSQTTSSGGKGGANKSLKGGFGLEPFITALALLGARMLADKEVGLFANGKNKSSKYEDDD